ncbi:hypothetical protein [Candidatus Reidiella endopervernicosa]|uniref:Uncharacterized protein n=1 Tax=Candidatus Reidiella endopervernicosa TaxID=2738883 RepID=A0A6N0HTX4_9GAMM|nr:hypothetical protein [Candidatus Reidiella endopervernicosa]QKQ25627.1 hypothetical protein HUE57_04440 [Candidatus Reidiella endopervernicosa]
MDRTKPHRSRLHPCDNPTEGDNCRQDGIRWIALEKRSTPLLLLVCHIGVNSQRAQLYEPNRAEPIREAVGAYFLNWSLDDDGIQIRYDSPSQDNEFSTNKESWP